MFSSVDGATLCSRCNENVDDDFIIVREYIYDNPSSSLKDISDGTGVETESILKWIREGKIVLASSSSIGFCEKCNEPTNGERFCPKCASELKLKLVVEPGTEPERKFGGMHIKDPGK